MDLTKAYKILELPHGSSLSEVKQAYRDLVQIWHPDRHEQNERVRKKAAEKTKELNAAYECVCLYFDSLKTSESIDGGSEDGTISDTVIICPQCGAKNQCLSPLDIAEIRCGWCGCYLDREGQKLREDDKKQMRRTLCADSACAGVIDSTGKCSKCGRTYAEVTAAAREETEKRNLQRNLSERQLRHKKAVLYTLACICAVVIFLFIYIEFRSPSVDGVGPLSDPVPASETVSGGSEAPIEQEPINPNRLITGFAPYTGSVWSGHSDIAVVNDTDTDAVVRVIRFRDNREERVRNFYIRARDRFAIDRIPPGEYVLRVAYGRDWNAKDEKFNYRRSFGETQRFTVDETTWTERIGGSEVQNTRSSSLFISLQKEPQGNFESHSITETEFSR